MEEDHSAGRGMLRALSDEMRGSDGWHLGLRLKDGTTMELAFFEIRSDGLEDFVVLNAGEIPGRPFGGRLFVPESAVAMAWATEDPIVIAPSVTPGGPRGAVAGGPADPGEPALVPTKCAWPTIAPLGSRWLDAAARGGEVWVRGEGKEWTLADPTYHVSDRPYVEVEAAADGWELPPGWEGSDLAVDPALASGAAPIWPMVARAGGGTSDEELADVVRGFVLRAVRYSPVGGAIIYPVQWEVALADYLRWAGPGGAR